MSKSLIDNVFEETLKYLEQMPKTKRKAIGQYILPDYLQRGECTEVSVSELNPIFFN